MTTALRSICRLLLLFLPFVVWGTCFAQTVTVNGATDPTGIPDADAYLAVFRMMVANTATPESQKIAAIGFTDPNDVTTFTNNMNYFALRLSQAQTADDMKAAANATEGQLQTQLTSGGLTIWQDYAQGEKWGMTLYGYGNCPDVIYTFQEGLWDNYQIPDYGSFEEYTDSWFTGNCASCTPRPLSTSTMSFNGSNWTPVLTKLSATITGTEKLAGTGSFNSPSIGKVQYIDIDFWWGDCGTLVDFTIRIAAEFAFSKFARFKGVQGTGCYGTIFGVICTWPVVPNCSNCSQPDYLLLAITDYTTWQYWDSVGACKALAWKDPDGTRHHSTWSCRPIEFNGVQISTVGVSDSSKVSCTYHPPN